MRELCRTEEGLAAWRNTATEADARRLLGALSNPQPEKHMSLVLDDEGQILLESLIRRGWVAWQEQDAPTPITNPTVAPSTKSFPAPPSMAPVARPLPKPAPAVSNQEIQDSLESFFQKLSS